MFVYWLFLIAALTAQDNGVIISGWAWATFIILGILKGIQVVADAIKRTSNE